MKLLKAPYTSTLYIWNAVSAFFFSSCLTPFHSHDTLQLLFAIGKKFRFRLQNEGWGEYSCLVIREHTIHQLDTNCSVQLIIYLDASSEIARRIQSTYLQNDRIFEPDIEITQCIKPGEFEKCLIEPNKLLLEQLVRRLLNSLVKEYPQVASDERISTITRMINTDPSGDWKVGLLAKKIFLSASRLRYLFKRSMGVPLHRYIIWSKIMIAVSKIMNGFSISDAALSSGFSDSSHFHKMMIKMFGVSPSQFLKNNGHLKVEICNHFPLRMQTIVFDEKSWLVENIFQE